MHLNLSDEETAALTQERHHLVEVTATVVSAYRTLTTILAKLDPPAPRLEPPPPLNAGAAPDVGCGRWRR